MLSWYIDWMMIGCTFKMLRQDLSIRIREKEKGSGQAGGVHMPAHAAILDPDRGGNQDCRYSRKNRVNIICFTHRFSSLNKERYSHDFLIFDLSVFGDISVSDGEEAYVEDGH